jgi:hypothetical protein
MARLVYADLVSTCPWFPSMRSASMASCPVTTLPVPLHEQPAIRARRWFLLAITCLSLVLEAAS